MSLPFFYINDLDASQKQIALNEETSKHIIQVLRMKEGEQLNLTDGKGSLLIGAISDDHKKHCRVEVKDISYKEKRTRKVSVAISLIKNASRFEWFLEKATEIGVTEIIPLICERTEKERFRYERMQGICISAMLQSQQCWLPVLHDPVLFTAIQKWKCADGTNFIAHCIDGNKQALSNYHIGALTNSLICIGPEGDFTSKETELALQHNFIPVSLGETRLRTETAGIVGTTLLCHI